MDFRDPALARAARRDAKLVTKLATAASSHGRLTALTPPPPCVERARARTAIT